MTEIEVKQLEVEKGRYYSIEAHGHAGAGVEGQDIVCAGISVLMQTLASTVEQMARGKELRFGAVSYREDGMSVEAMPREDSGAVLEALYEFVLTGLTALAGQYPENLRLILYEPEEQEEAVNLQLFAEGAEAAAQPTADPAAVAPAGKETGPKAARGKSGLEDVVYGKQDAQAQPPAEKAEDGPAKDGEAAGQKAKENPADKNQAFLELIKGEYAEQFQTAMRTLAGRQPRADPKIEGLLAALGEKYGVDSRDIDSLTSAVKGVVKDDAYYEKYAMEHGVSVKTARELDKLESENAQLQRQRDEARAAQAGQRMQAQIQAIRAGWEQQAEAMKAKYPSFDFAACRANPAFADLMKLGVNLETAYRAVYFDQLLADSQSATAQAVEKGVTERIAARNARPNENGTRPSGAATVKADVNSLSKADREEIERRVMHGAKIRF